VVLDMSRKYFEMLKVERNEIANQPEPEVEDSFV
jgi:hypothetical protein